MCVWGCMTRQESYRCRGPLLIRCGGGPHALGQERVPPQYSEQLPPVVQLVLQGHRTLVRAWWAVPGGTMGRQEAVHQEYAQHEAVHDGMANGCSMAWLMGTRSHD